MAPLVVNRPPQSQQLRPPGEGASSEGTQTLLNYTFSDIEVGDSVDPVSGETRQGIAEVAFTYGWASNAFPGWHRCTFVVRDQDGSAVGEKSHEFAGLNPGDRSETTVDIVGDPARADISCSTDRLDDPSGRYEFSNVRVTSSAFQVSEGQEYDVRFDVQWIGASALPAPSECEVALYGSDGNVLFRVQSVVGGAGRLKENGRLRVIPPPSVDEEPTDARIACRAFTR
ncbi:MAG: hypothetical protein ACRDK3_00055 [Actinomycetota bacterium]